jgi:hypothetical protein
MGMHIQALDNYSKSLMEENRATTFNNMGSLFFSRGNNVKALLLYEKCIYIQ